MNNVSPLRYPGGKTKLYPYIKKIIDYNNLNRYTYVEPFAGGCGLALKLLMNNDVERIIINDFDHAIYAFWYSILNYTDEFCKKIATEPIDIEHWYLHKMIYKNQRNYTMFEVGFSTFFLNRTNRSGIINGGIIGGVDQRSKLYTIDCRFNREKLIEKIRNIENYKEKIQLYEMDACRLIKEILVDFGRSVVYFDPPYVKKGKELYKNYFDFPDHEELKQYISKYVQQPWIVTYDNRTEIAELYEEYYQEKIDINYSAGINKRGSELAIYSNNLLSVSLRDESLIDTNELMNIFC